MQPMQSRREILDRSRDQHRDRLPLGVRDCVRGHEGGHEPGDGRGLDCRPECSGICREAICDPPPV